MEDRRRMRLIDWVNLVGLILSLVMLGSLLFSWGNWTGSVNKELQNMNKRLDLFNDIPVRVAYLEGMHNIKVGN